MTIYISSIKNGITFAAVSTSGFTKLHVIQTTTRAFEYIYGVLWCVVLLTLSVRKQANKIISKNLLYTV